MNTISTDELTDNTQERETAQRDCAVAWEAYEDARARLMDSILHEYGSVAARDRMAHPDLTEVERTRVVAEEKATAQAAWLGYLDAEAHLGMLETSFAPRRP